MKKAAGIGLRRIVLVLGDAAPAPYSDIPKLRRDAGLALSSDDATWLYVPLYQPKYQLTPN
jgi:hypothetical protein